MLNAGAAAFHFGESRTCYPPPLRPSSGTGAPAGIGHYNPVGRRTLYRSHLIPIQPDFAGDLVRLHIQQAILQALDLPSEMVAVVHDDHVLAFRLGGRAEARK